MPIIPALGRLRLEDSKFEASLDYAVRLCPKNSECLLYTRPFNRGDSVEVSGLLRC
jgi:hypothetical protein